MKGQWHSGYVSTTGDPMSIFQYCRSVILNEPIVQLSGQLLGYFILDCFSRNLAQKTMIWYSAKIQQRLVYAWLKKHLGQIFPPGKVCSFILYVFVTLLIVHHSLLLLKFVF
jgi:hypothetical protein